MKAPSLVAVALVAVAFTGVAQAGPTSTLYVTTQVGLQSYIVVVRGNNVIQTIPDAYGVNEFGIAVYGDVRTIGYYGDARGGQYSLGLTATGTTYAAPYRFNVLDSTSDGTRNYLVDSFIFANQIYQTARNFTNPTYLFTFGSYLAGSYGITYDAANNSLWICCDFSYNGNSTVGDYSLGGVLLSSFSVGGFGPLALDPSDHTLWLEDRGAGYLQQYSMSGVRLSTGPYLGVGFGAEFDLSESTATPEPGTMIMFGSGVLGLAGILRRKINL